MDPRKLLRIARWEVTKNAGGIDRRTVAVAVLALAVIGVLAPAVASQGVALDEGLYRVGIEEESPYYEVVASDLTFAVQSPEPGALDRGEIDLRVRGRTIQHAPTAKGRAALEELRSSVRAYNDRRLREEPNRTAAFPVSVIVQYEIQADAGSAYRPSADSSGGGSTTDADGTDGESSTTSPSGSPREASGATGGTDTDTQGTSTPAGSADATGDAAGTAGRSGDGTDDTAAVADTGGSVTADGEQSGTSPSDIAPPFPFRSLVLAFVFIVPLNFLIQAYGSTILSERLNRRGELLLVAPVSRLDIVGGKTAPYFLGALAIEGSIAVGLTYLRQGTIGGLVSVLAVVPLVCLFLAATFLGAMFARSFKELTFVTVTITVSLTSYAFVPAIFTDVNPIALISPLTLVVRDLQNQAITAPQFAFSTLPPLLSAGVLFGLGLGLYREEDMFAQRPIPLKMLDALAGRVRRRWHVLAVTAALLPFVFVLELLAIAVLFALQELSIPLVLIAVAVIEEVAKSLHVYAAYVHDRFDRLPRTALIVGTLSGVGFFLGEKITLLAQLVGLPELAIGSAALSPVSGPVVVAFLLAPLALHVVTATVSALGASRGRRSYLGALVAAILLHLAYNYGVVVLVG